MAEQSRRFVSPDKPIDKFIEDQKNKNTLSKTRRDVSLLTEFLNSKNESRRIEEIPPKELNEYISEFIIAVKRKDGEDFEPSSLRGLICSLIFRKEFNTEVKSDHRSKFSNLSNWKVEAWKKKKKNRASTGFEPMTSAIPVRCSTNWAMKPHIGSKVNLLSSFLPVQWNHVKYISNNSYLYCGMRRKWRVIIAVNFPGSNPVEALIFFRLLLSNCLNWKIYCDDHPSLSSHTAVQIWIISYIFHMISLHGKKWTQ